MNFRITYVNHPMNKKSQWGLFFFLASAISCAGALYFTTTNPYDSNKNLYTIILPLTGLFFSATSFFAGHFSYPRVHNLKVYLTGYTTLLFGISYFVLFRFLYPLPIGSAPQGFVYLLYILMFINGLLFTILPSSGKYRSVRQITLTVVTIETILLVTARFSQKASSWLHFLSFDTMWDVRFFLPLFFFAITLALSLWKVRHDFHLGGLLCGIALFFIPSWMSRFFYHGFNPIETMLFAIMPAYCTIGILIHWFLRLDHRISYDPLLHIYNRDYCSKIISEQSNLNVTPPFTIAMVDIDHFKSVNDTHGHQAGDQVLYTVAQTICKTSAPHGTVCRYGGEEMIVFFPQKTIKQVESIAENIRKSIEAVKTKTRKKNLSVTVSIGISCKDQAGLSIIDVIHAADKAMYKAKEGGRNQVKTMKAVAEVSKK